MVGGDDRLQVAFPANDTFTRIGRVAVAGLALRLDIDISAVERLRLAVDAAVTALHGDGRINVSATWKAEGLEVVLSNPDARIENQSELADELGALVDRATVDYDRVELQLAG